MIIASQCVGEKFTPGEQRNLLLPIPIPGWIGNFDHQVHYRFLLTTEFAISVSEKDFKIEKKR